MGEMIEYINNGNFIRRSIIVWVDKVIINLLNCTFFQLTLFLWEGKNIYIYI